MISGSTDYSSIAPPHSYINVNNFEDIQGLAKYLQDLLDNPKKYYDYFKWKKYFNVYGIEQSLKNAMCQLCESLNLDKKHKIYHNIDDWWRKKANCQIKGYFRYDITYNVTFITLKVVLIISVCIVFYIGIFKIKFY